MKPPPTHQQALEQWQEEVEDHIPGLKISSLPKAFLIPITLEGGRKTLTPVEIGWSEMVAQQDQWSEVPGLLKYLVTEKRACDWEAPEGWDYRALAEKVAPGEQPHRLDIPNPRLYTLEGWQVPRGLPPGNTAQLLQDHFKRMLGQMWQHGPFVTPANPTNKREKRIRELLDYHHLHGGNPGAFVSFVEGIARDPKSMPPPPTGDNVIAQALTGQATPLLDPDGLSGLLSKWVSEASKHKAENLSSPPLSMADERAGGEPAHHAAEAMRLPRSKGGTWIHPDAQAAADAQREEAAKYPKTYPRAIATDEDPDALEAEARKQFEEERRLHVPGFAFSAIPKAFVVPYTKLLPGNDPKRTPANPITVRLGERWRDVEQWHGIADAIRQEVNDQGAECDLPKGWSFAKLVGDAKPERFDLCNPRIYTLDGRQVPWDMQPGSVGRRYLGNFEYMLKELFIDAPKNVKRAEVVAFLEHHRTHGGNPKALADHVNSMLVKWREEPPRYLDMRRMKQVEVPDAWLLLETLKEWLKMARKAPSPSGDAPTFAALLGDDLPAVLEAMKDAGIRPVMARGKGKVVAALHAGCNFYGKTIPLPSQWPDMLEQLFPGYNWSEKNKPIENQRERESAKTYNNAYRATLDRLK